MRLSAISKNILLSRIVDKYGYCEWDSATEWLDGLIVSKEMFSNYNSMYDSIVNNYRKLIIY